MTRYYLDTEFIEDGHTIDLVSIGVVCEDGREFYRENSEADLTKASPWVRMNVLPHLQGGGIPRDRLRHELQEFVEAGEDTPEFWGWYSDYDWVVVAQLFGTMVDLPEGWPMRCNDLQQLADTLGVTALPPQTGTVHDARADARWNRAVHEHLLALPACTHSRVEALDLLAGHRAGKTPRIDTMRNRLHATLQLLAMVGEELDDLHVLAYDRRAVADDDVKVAGGQRDYALDTNGDMQARDAYRNLALAQADMFDVAAEAAHDAVTVLRRGERTAPRGPRMIQAIELADAIAHQAKRAAAGEYTPFAREPQPEADRAAAAVADLTRQHDDALKLVERQGKLVERLANHNPVARNAMGEHECHLCGAVNPKRPGHHTEDCLWRLARARMKK